MQFFQVFWWLDNNDAGYTREQKIQDSTRKLFLPENWSYI